MPFFSTTFSNIFPENNLHNQLLLLLKSLLLLLSLTILLMENQLAGSPNFSDPPLLPLLDSLNMQLDHSFEDS